ncbi:MAG: ligase-associated DNA damage response DEXH box helicase [Bacteroidia bacterium]|nr:ligase-associated DNA damage response DEXH box helicase [Bacteroidia bacterium]
MDHVQEPGSLPERLAAAWYTQRGWTMFPFQAEMLAQYLQGNSGLLNAPTGAGKTYALWLPAVLDWVGDHPDTWQTQTQNGLQVLWITPLRALSQDITQACQTACDELGVRWRVETRTGDTSSAQKDRQRKHMPEGLITTPESLHVLFSTRDHLKLFAGLRAVIVDEWHELLGSKRGVQTELVLAHLRRLRPDLRVWGISATIGNLDQARAVLLGARDAQAVTVRADIRKEIRVESILPDTIERFPWAGHLGIRMLDKVLPVIQAHRSTLLFTNTRAQAEIWYQALLEADPDLAGLIAMHHGSISAETRAWVEESLHQGILKVVICTSSLDLGVDFRPVEAIIQVGGPKGIARFVQRAGRSGHRPGAVSHIFFVPTHSLELVEAAALREAVTQGVVEERTPVVRPYDVLVQYLLTLAAGDGFRAAEVLAEVRDTFAFRALSEDAFAWAVRFVTVGGDSLQAYEMYHKVIQDETGCYRMENRRQITQHRLSIGTIVSDVNLTVKFVSGGRLGTVEESFIAQFKEGDTFWFGGRLLELVRVRHLEVLVRRAEGTKGIVPRWMGSRMQLSSQMAHLLRQQLDDWRTGHPRHPELTLLAPLFEKQQRESALPSLDQCLIEQIKSREGYHVFVYPFEGRIVHEVLAAVTAWRISRLQPITFSIAMNDYGFELLSSQPIPLEAAIAAGVFSPERLDEDLMRSLNETEMAQRRFREIASIAGLVFKGFPGKAVTGRHLQASTSLLFQVFRDYDPDNLLLQQAYTEVIDYQVDIHRLHAALTRMAGQQLLLTHPRQFTPFCFPIMVDRLRERLSSEKLADRVMQMQVLLGKEG